MYPCQNQQALLADETMLTPNKNTPDPSIWAKSSALHQRALSEREILSRHLWGGGERAPCATGRVRGALTGVSRSSKPFHNGWWLAGGLPRTPLLAFARMIWKPLELQTDLEQGLWCLLAPPPPTLCVKLPTAKPA